MSKYEGHTPRPWWYEKEGGGDRYFVVCELTECNETVICIATYGEKDARLIADAPKLAEENEQLREVLRWYADTVADVNRRGEEGIVSRDALAKDAGKRARSLLQEVECE